MKDSGAESEVFIDTWLLAFKVLFIGLEVDILISNVQTKP